MKRIYLYLDESGNFKSDGDMLDNPSLVGGYLKYDSPMSIEEAKQICNGKQIHCCKMPYREFASMALTTLQDMRDRKCYFVIFENKERLEVVDGDTTYLNIISEGVVQLMQLLKSRFGAIEFNLLVAQRVAVQRPEYKYRKEGYYISWAEYIKRLQEKIIIGATKITSDFNIKKWDIQFSDGNTDFRLMLADVVCHTRFRKNKKFDNNQKEKIKLLCDEDLIFSVFPSELEVSIKRFLIKGNIAEAIFELLTSDTMTAEKKYLIEIKNSLENISEFSRDIQYKTLCNRIMNLLHVGDDLQLIQSIIDKLRKYILKNPSFEKIIPFTFAMDISLICLTIATHEGAIKKANDEIQYCKSLLSSLVRRWESLDYYFIFKIRQAVHLINSYDLYGCIEEMNELENLINNTFALFPLADGLSDICNDIKSDVKGKVYGNRLQARLNLIKSDSNQYLLAVSDSENAIKEFSRTSDLKRQYQYRARIEYESGDYTNAIDWLKKSITLDNSSSMSNLISNNKLETAFNIMHLVNIMVVVLESGDNEIFTNLNSVWKNNNFDKYLTNNVELRHPYEIIYWKLGKIEFLNGNITAGEKKLDYAISICNKTKENQTLKAIGLGILADKVYLLSTITPVRKMWLDKSIYNLCSGYESFMGMELPDSMRNYFSNWSEDINLLKINKIKYNYKNLKDFSEQICY